MGKNQHSKDRLFLTATEWREQYGGKKQEKEAHAYALPFDCCAMSMRPFSNPVLTPDGIVFDILNIVPYVRKNKKNPVTGNPLKTKDLVRLHFHKNKDGVYHDPVTYKVFGPHTHIAAVKTSGNVYAYATVKQLNFDTGNLKDLLSSEPFTRKDVVVLQDPNNPALRHYTLQPGVEVSGKAAKPAPGVRATNSITQRVMKEVARKSAEKAEAQRVAAKRKREDDASKEAESKDDPEAIKAAERKQVREYLVAQARKTSNFSAGTYSRSFTSSALSVDTKRRAADMTEAEIDTLRYDRVRALKKKAYVRLQTNKGNLNLEIHADIVPKTAENFVGLCRKGYYNGTVFHRSIKNFMIQGGDPTGTGRGGESLWGGKFKDEFHNKLTHTGRGMVCMANAGPDTNGSQFYITFKSCNHLDRKHSVFGKLVGGMDVLRDLELIPVDDGNRPTDEIKIISTPVFQDPFEEADKAVLAEIAAQTKAKSKEAAVAARKAEMARVEKLRKARSGERGVGKYIAASAKRGLAARAGAGAAAGAGGGAGAGGASSAAAGASGVGAAARARAAAAGFSQQIVHGKKKRRATKTTFGDFSGW